MNKLASYTALLSRRRAIALFGAAATAAGYDGGTLSVVGTASGRARSNSPNASCVLTPQEITGPFPLFDDLAGASKYMRRDIAEDRAGAPLQLLLTVIDVNDDCAPIEDALVYVWHCDKDGLYSGYRQSGTSTVGKSFCRGIQPTNGAGLTRFSTLYPGWYPGRVTHVHFRVYLGKSLQVTSQLTFPQDVTRAVYNSSLYATRGQNTSVGSIRSDGVFSDGEQYQICKVTDNASRGGYDAALTIGIAL